MALDMKRGSASLASVCVHVCTHIQSVHVSHWVISGSLWPDEPQYARPPYPSSTPGVHPDPIHWVSDAIQPSHPLCSPFPPTPNLSQHQGLFKWVSSSHQVAKVLEFQVQHQSFQFHSGQISFRMDWLDLLAIQGTLKSLLQHRSSSINSSVLSFLHSPTLTSIHDYWKNHNVD